MRRREEGVGGKIKGRKEARGRKKEEDKLKREERKEKTKRERGQILEARRKRKRR